MSAVVVHASALALAGLVLVAAGQPLFAEDSWWHLALGRVYAASGPDLAADPFLFTAAGPPAPAAWLADVALHGVERASGFTGLRVAHALLAAAILALGWSLLRRSSGSAVFASLSTSLFAALGAYRLFQLRPHLLTMLGTLLLLRWLLASGRPASRLEVALAVLWLGLWANLHGGFVLGLALLGAGAAGALLAALLPRARVEALRRARSLVLALVLGGLATLANPAGVEPHRLLFEAGAATPDLGVVADEWIAFPLFTGPYRGAPPSPLAWGIVWALLLATPLAVGGHLAARRRGSASEPLDPVLLAVGAASLVAMVSAVRLLWLGLVPLLVVGASARALGLYRGSAARAFAWASAAAAVALVPGFVRLGAWPMISQGVQLGRYVQPYPAIKYPAEAVWFLRDAGLEGRLFNDYQSGNFLSYWLAPRMQVFVNGSLNVPREAMDALFAARQRRGVGPDERFVDMLDRYEIDVFLGRGSPRPPPPGRHSLYSTTHLEREPGWTMVFRNARSAVYLRNGEGSRANLQRVIDYYRSEGVPFDPDRGFDAAQVIRDALPWAAVHGVIPLDFGELRAGVRSLDPQARRVAPERLATVYAVLGLYDQASALDARRRGSGPDAAMAQRRLVWSLLHAGRTDEALVAAERLEAIAPANDAIAQAIAQAARRVPELGPEEAAAMVATLPLLTVAQSGQLAGGYLEPQPRLPER